MASPPDAFDALAGAGPGGASPAGLGRVLRSGRVVRSAAKQLRFEDKYYKAIGLVAALGFWEAWRLPQVSRELRFGFSGGGAAADLVRDALEKRGVWAKLKALRATKRVDGWTALLFASGSGDVQRVCEAIELGWAGCVDASNPRGVTPLMRASGAGHEGVVRALLAAGADATAAAKDGTTALHAACGGGREAVARLLVAAGADVGASDRAGKTPLAALPAGCDALAGLLRAAGATA